MTPRIYKTAHPVAPWQVVYRDPTRRDRRGASRKFRRHFADEARAREYLRELTAAAHLEGVTGISFDANLRADAIGARRVLDAAGHTGLTLLELAREAARKPAVDQRSRVLMAPLVEDFLESQRRDNRAGSTVRNLAVRIAAWITRERIGTLADVTDATLLALKQRRNVSAQTRINDMAAVSSLLSCVVNERRLLPVNPLTSISRPTVDVRVPR